MKELSTRLASTNSFPALCFIPSFHPSIQLNKGSQCDRSSALGQTRTGQARQLELRYVLKAKLSCKSSVSILGEGRGGGADTERWWIGEVRGESDYDEVLVGGGI